MTAGPHELGVTFLKNSSSLLETKRQPFQAHYNMHRHPRLTPAVYQVSITGPYDSQGPGDTPSRRRIFVCEPKAAERRGGLRQAHRVHAGCAEPIGGRSPMPTCESRWSSIARPDRGGGFDAGIEMAPELDSGNPQFLFRIEPDPPGLPARTALSHRRTSSWPRGCRSSSGAAFPTTNCSTWPSAAN